MLIFRERNTEADAWAEKGVRGPQEDWEDDSKVVWSDVTGLCGFWDGSCFHTIMGWATIYKKCGPVPGKNSIDAEIAGCSMLIESLKKGWTHVCMLIKFHRGVSRPHAWCIFRWNAQHAN